MTRGMIYKLLFILSIIAFCVLLILPTIGEKQLRVTLLKNATKEQVAVIEKRFSKKYTVKKKGNQLLISGTNITDAVMNDLRRYKGVADAVILKHWAENMLKAKKINLGLDLQGGMHIVLQANYDRILSRLQNEKATLQATKQKLQKAKKKNKKKIEDIDRQLKDFDEFYLNSEGKLSEKYKNEISKQALESLRNRVDKFGVAEPSIRPRGNEAIELQLPGVKNPQDVKKAIKTTSPVEYRFTNKRYTEEAKKWLATEYKDANGKPIKELPSDSNERVAAAKRKALLEKITKEIKLPRDLELLYFFDRKPNSKDIYPKDVIVLERKVQLAGDDIKRAYSTRDEYGGLAVGIETTPDGASKFAKVTSKPNWGKQLAIVIEGKVRSAPSLSVQISSGKAQITGSFSPEEVRVLSRIIQEGALPVDLRIIEERNVGPSLGQDAIENGVKAILIGLMGVMLFMLIYYKVGGFIADIGLVLNMVFMLALLSWLGFTLTLPGIAGFILTVGMAVDANVIIYERIKEELRSGKSVRMGILYGFDKAFWTIIDANLTTLIAAFILSQYGTGPIKGFAVILLIGILSSMFVALYITRFVYEIISLNKKLKKLYL